jgi:uncharacterized HAD superfamily protein
MIIGIDIDGVLANSEPAYRRTINRLFHLKLKQEDITFYKYEDAAGLTDTQMHLFWTTFYREGSWLKIKPIKGARKFLDKLKNAQHRIVIVTSRPQEYIKKETYQWLREHRMPYTELIFLANHDSKHQAAWVCGHKFDYFIEDYYEYALDLAQRGVKVLLVDYPWNRKEKAHPNIKRIKNLQEAETIIFKGKAYKK